MKLENQVCTPVQSIRLKELGVIQESNYQWNLTTHAEPYLNVPPFGKVDNNGLSYSAFTVAELGVMLPDGDNKTYTQFSSLRVSKEYSIETGKYGYGCIADCMSETVQAPYFEKIAPTEAEARAAMLIYLIEADLTTAAEVNERLKNA